LETFVEKSAVGWKIPGLKILELQHRWGCTTHLPHIGISRDALQQVLCKLVNLSQATLEMSIGPVGINYFDLTAGDPVSEKLEIPVFRIPAKTAMTLPLLVIPAIAERSAGIS
jgi:hypothetical protein